MSPATTPVFAALIALTAAICWGTGDFSGGLASRRSDAFSAVLLSYCVGLALMVVLALGRGEPLSSPTDLGWGALSGLAGMVGVGLLYRGFTLGRMGIVSPISAVLASALPVIFAALTKGLPRELQLAGFAVALVGIWLLARPDRIVGRPKGLGMAVLAGVGFGGFFIGLSQVGKEAVFWPLATGRAASIATMLAFALATHRRVKPQRNALGFYFLTGVLDVSGNLFFLLATQLGRVDVTAVLGSLYPAVTAVVAWWAIKERLTRLQVIGIGAAVMAIVMITV
jgi:drug/metabolite transporter (DMT)-like permease